MLTATRSIDVNVLVAISLFPNNFQLCELINILEESSTGFIAACFDAKIRGEWSFVVLLSYA